MRRLFSLFLAAACLVASGPAFAAETALSALKVLPKEAAANVVTIHGFEGKPLPDRWHIMTFDPQAQNGVREYVIANGEIVAERSVSQFAQELKEEEVVGAEVLKLDADKVQKTAEKYAQANRAKVAFYNFELKRDGPRAAPLWHVACMDANGESLGSVVVSASKGGVVAHDGFPIAPGPERTEREPRLTSRETMPREERFSSRTDPRRVDPARRPVQPPPQPSRGGFFDRVFGGGR